jgi:ribosomal protein L37AE/L43A
MSQETSEPLTGKAGVEQFMGYGRRPNSPISISKVASSRQSSRRRTSRAPPILWDPFSEMEPPHLTLPPRFQFSPRNRFSKRKYQSMTLATNRHAFRCPVCERSVARRSRQQRYCGNRCRNKARYKPAVRTYSARLGIDSGDRTDPPLKLSMKAMACRRPGRAFPGLTSMT